MFTSRGPGFRRLAQAHAGSVAADSLVAMALAGTLFFDVPSTEARDKVALYLLITLAPFAVIGPFLGAAYARFPGAYRGGMVFSSGLRAALALAMVVWLDGSCCFRWRLRYWCCHACSASAAQACFLLFSPAPAT